MLSLNPNLLVLVWGQKSRSHRHWRLQWHIYHLFLSTVKRTTECRNHFKTALLRLLPGRFVPRCGADGSYDQTQCLGSICLCVDERGIAIPGTSEPRFIEPNCESQGEKVVHPSCLLLWQFFFIYNITLQWGTINSSRIINFKFWIGCWSFLEITLHINPGFMFVQRSFRKKLIFRECLFSVWLIIEESFAFHTWWVQQ